MLAAIPDINELLMRAVAVIPALTFHEFAHAWAAYRAGDDTAYRMGRLSLNPLVHLDPIGTIMLLFGPIGWAKPVPVNPMNFRQPRRDDIIVSVAGVTTNALLAIVWTVVLGLLYWLENSQAAGVAMASGEVNRFLSVMIEIAVWAVFINVALAVFNLIPIPPLDGSHVLGHMLKGEAALRYAQLARFGPILLIVFVVFDMRTHILFDLIYSIVKPLVTLANRLATVAA